MIEQKKSITDILSATITALRHIIIIIKRNSSVVVDAPPLLKQRGYIFVAISALRNSQLMDFLKLTDNELKILDYVIQYRAITSRNLRNFLKVRRRQIYNYLDRLHSLGFLTYTTIPIGEGPATRFYHFANLSQQDLTNIVISEKITITAAHKPAERDTYECSKCGGVINAPKGITPFEKCPHCKFTKNKVWIRID